GGERVALLAIGNARASSFLPQVTPYLRGNDPAYREVAAGTLQHMRGPEVTSLLTERLNADPDARVRRAAAKSLAEQPADLLTMNFVIGSIDREKDATVQTELARYLGRAAARDSNARAALERLWNTSDNRDALRIVRDVRRGRTP
ncbi:MAG: HEAT repeat domain-containing protein, partial [Synergistaceae bacterium]|nr:HEAT repeat domain-containing protein [Synergistaceae bacterium]